MRYLELNWADHSRHISYFDKDLLHARDLNILEKSLIDSTRVSLFQIKFVNMKSRLFFAEKKHENNNVF